jgi:uncharacterized protein
MRSMNALDWAAMVLLVIGGLNWGLVGLFGMDAVATLFGIGSAVTQLVYVLVGVSALYAVVTGLMRAWTFREGSRFYHSHV